MRAIFFNTDNFFPLNISGETNFEAITVTTALTFFAFLGIESATIPADGIKNPEKTIPKATIIGTTITLIIYILSTIALMGIMHPSEIANSSAPYADATGMILGDYGKNIIAIFAIISGIGCLNGWTLLQIEIPKNLAKNKLLGTIFSDTNSREVPYKGLIISTIFFIDRIDKTRISLIFAIVCAIAVSFTMFQGLLIWIVGIFGLLFVIFDVEAVFIFPWALNLENLGYFGLVEMFIFIFILLLGLIYAIRKDVLKWE